MINHLLMVNVEDCWVVARPKVSASARWQSEWCFVWEEKWTHIISAIRRKHCKFNFTHPNVLPFGGCKTGRLVAVLCHASLSNSRELPVILHIASTSRKSTTSPRKSYQHISQTPTRGWTSNMDLGLSPQLVVASWKFQATSLCPRTTATGHIIQAVLPDFYHTLLKQTSQFSQLQHWLLWQCL